MTELAIRLKEGTKESHSAAENTKFVASFLRGVISNENYGLLVANFYFVYRAMEEEIDKLMKEDMKTTDKHGNETGV